MYVSLLRSFGSVWVKFATILLWIFKSLLVLRSNLNLLSPVSNVYKSRVCCTSLFLCIISTVYRHIQQVAGLAMPSIVTMYKILPTVYRSFSLADIEHICLSKISAVH